MAASFYSFRCVLTNNIVQLFTFNDKYYCICCIAFIFTDNNMGNTKCTPVTENITTNSSKQSQHTIIESRKSSSADEQAKYSALSERDIAFLCSQTGNC